MGGYIVLVESVSAAVVAACLSLMKYTIERAHFAIKNYFHGTSLLKQVFTLWVDLQNGVRRVRLNPLIFSPRMRSICEDRHSNHLQFSPPCCVKINVGLCIYKRLAIVQ